MTNALYLLVLYRDSYWTNCIAMHIFIHYRQILEGMPLSLLEAMSYGNCCLVSDIPECIEVVEDKAIVFKKDRISMIYEINCKMLVIISRWYLS